MESNYRNKEFEQFVKENADDYKMFPSEKVWKGIHNTLHTRRKWYGIGLAFLLFLTGTAVTVVMTTYPVSKKSTSTTSLKPVIPSTPADKDVVAAKTAEDIKKLLPFASESDEATKRFIAEAPKNINGPLSSPIVETAAVTVIETSFPQEKIISRAEKEQFATLVNAAKSDNATITEEAVTTADAPAVAAAKQVNLLAANTIESHQEDVFSPLTIESVTNQYKAKPKRISLQLFVTPTVSYRKLSVNKSFDNATAPNFPFTSLRDVNNAVTHKPDMGLQIGLSAGYPLTKALKLRGGLQFNVNRYDIKAFVYNGEVATINLSGGNGNNSVSTWTYYRNQSGYRSDWLKNYYFSISAPVGAELKLLGNKKTHLGVAGTIQPTYVLSDRAYLISTDYKNYAEVPNLIRHFNVNTSFETFVNFTGGKTKWQIGPQVRYQILSSFKNTYPVKENLFDFGMKIGVTLNN